MKDTFPAPVREDDPVGWLRSTKPWLFQSPPFWRVSNEAIESTVAGLQTGEKLLLGTSAGQRPLLAAAFGQFEPQESRATISSALGSGTLRPFFDATKRSKPTCVVIGSIHGGETAGVALAVNLIQLLDQGADFGGQSRPGLVQAFQQARVIIIPCLNPDGREAVGASHFCGADWEDVRLLQQGLRQDGRTFGGPAVKEIQPIPAGYLKHMGGYYTSAGVNLHHDDFFGPRVAPENQALQTLFRHEIPDAFIVLHAHSAQAAFVAPDAYLAPAVQRKQVEAASFIMARLMADGHLIRPPDESQAANWSFNLQCWLHHMTGALPLLFEFPQQINSSPDTALPRNLDLGYALMESWMQYIRTFGARPRHYELLFAPFRD